MRLLSILFFILISVAANADTQIFADKVRNAMAADIRMAEEVQRDPNRKPGETLSFFQMRDDMRVLELVPGGGWYTKILASVLREKGELYIAIGADRVGDSLTKEDGFDHINVIGVDAEMSRTGPFNTVNVGEMDFGVRDLDLVLTFRNMHNFTVLGRSNINAAAYLSLKSGGLYGVVDHTLRHMEPISAENRRRADAVQIIKEVQDAGFLLVDYSDLHYHPDDELVYEVGHESVSGKTDRFTLLFRRP